MNNRGYLVAIAMVCMLGACKNDEKACATRADELNAREQALNQREEQLNAREKQMAGSNMNTAVTGDSSDMNANVNSASNAAGKMAGKEPSLFRKNKARTGYPHSNTPGQFPEGTDRALADKDLEYLSPWGVKVITNEIYARHGMIFTDPELKRHFDEEKWYHGRTKNVNGTLTKTEKQNISFISNFKAQEE